jgi:hypothetical protein
MSLYLLEGIEVRSATSTIEEVTTSRAPKRHTQGVVERFGYSVLPLKLGNLEVPGVRLGTRHIGITTLSRGAIEFEISTTWPSSNVGGV